MTCVKEFTFNVSHPGDSAAGLRGYADTVTVLIESGDPGGPDGEFDDHVRGCLAEWFDGATVEFAGWRLLRK